MEKENLVLKNFYAQLKYDGVYTTEGTIDYFEAKGIPITLEEIFFILENQEEIKNNFKYEITENGNRMYVEKEKEFPEPKNLEAFFPYFYNTRILGKEN